MKTKEELNDLKNELNIFKQKLNELSEDELKIVTGGIEPEEFDWINKRYQTPIKKDNGTGWRFEPIADKDSNYRKNRESYTGRTNEEK